MSQPTPKQNFLQTAMLMITIFLAFNLFFNRPQQAPPPVGNLYQTLLDQDAKGLQNDAAQTRNQYDQQLDEQVKKKQITQAEADDKKLEAAVINADAALRTSIARNQSQPLRTGYQFLIPFEKQYRSNPTIWNKVYQVAKTSDSRFPWHEWSAKQLYGKIVDDLSVRNKSDLIWGFIPGGYQFVDALVNLTGAKPGFSYAFAAFLLALVVRAIVFPLSQKQYMFSRQMSQLSPLVKEIRQKYGADQKGPGAKPADQAQIQTKTMELYREYGINPVAGCIPALIQMPLFLTVYQCMLHYQFTFQKGTFLWINPVTSAATHGFVAPNLGQLDYILIAIYGVSMVISTMLTPITDPSQAKQQRLMGVGISVFFTISMCFGLFPVPAGFVLYWTFTNILATAQALRAYRMPLPPLVKVNAAGGGVYPQGIQGKWARMLEDVQKAQMDQRPDRDKKDVSSFDKSNGSSNGSFNGQSKATGAPAKHKPKKRK